MGRGDRPHRQRGPGDTNAQSLLLIWQCYFRELLDLARKNLDKRVRHRADEEDVLQSMFQSFCARQGCGEFNLADRDELWRLLVTSTLRKARNAARDHHRDRRDIAREQTQSVQADEASSCPGWAFEQMDASGPSPAEAVVLNEAQERRLASLADPELRQIALWRLEGFTNREIADQLDCTERSVERRLERVRSKWTSYDDRSS
jgi:RNA polymerase sigma factor (sigma-70 family)